MKKGCQKKGCQEELFGPRWFILGARTGVRNNSSRCPGPVGDPTDRRIGDAVW